MAEVFGPYLVNRLRPSRPWSPPRPPPGPTQLPKSLPDFESCGAVYVAVEEVERLPLRSAEPRHWLPYVARGGPIFPLSVFTPETAPVLAP